MEDTQLKTLAERYPNNWPLVAEAFNSSRLTISTDRRTPYDCFERWNTRFNTNGKPGDATPDVTLPPTPASASVSTTTQMTTRGVKRLASASISGAPPLTIPGTGEGKRRRRHGLVLDAIRKSIKKKDQTAKTAAAAQQKKAAGAVGEVPNMHSTHEMVQKLQPLTPLELSRIKAEREAKEHNDLLVARRRHEELARQNVMAHRQQVAAQQAQLKQQAIANSQSQQQAAQAQANQAQQAQHSGQLSPMAVAQQQQAPQQVQMPQQAVTAMVNAVLSHPRETRLNRH